MTDFDTAAESWLALDELVRNDPTVTAVEFGTLSRASGFYDCRIRRNRPVHVIVGDGSSLDAALREAIRLYHRPVAA